MSQVSCQPSNTWTVSLISPIHLANDLFVPSKEENERFKRIESEDDSEMEEMEQEESEDERKEDDDEGKITIIVW